MKKNCELKIKKENQDDKKVNYSIYDLFYWNLKDFINEFNAKRVSNPYKLIREYMEKNNIVSAEKLFRPIIINSNTIKKDSKEYIDEIILNKYLRHLGIIKEDEIILFNTFEEELVDMNELINDIYNKDIKDKDILLNETNQKVNTIIDDIFNYVLVK